MEESREIATGSQPGTKIRANHSGADVLEAQLGWLFCLKAKMRAHLKTTATTAIAIRDGRDRGPRGALVALHFYQAPKSKTQHEELPYPVGDRKKNLSHP
jgi:hypothetical protein